MKRENAPHGFGAHLVAAAGAVTSLLCFLGFLPLRLSESLELRLAIAVAVGCLSALVTDLILRSAPRYKSISNRARQLQLFCATIKKAASTLELQEILDASVRVVAEVTGVEGCSINLLEEDTGKMTARARVGVQRDVAIERATYQSRLLSGKPLVIRDTLAREFPEVDDEIESLICVPLRLEERIFGSICIYGEPGRRLSDEMISLLSSLGDVISLAIAHAMVYKEVKRLSDAKTMFLLHASHELRSPANAISSIASTLLDGYLGEITQRQRELIGRIHLRAQTLSEVVSDLHVLTRGRMEQSSFKPVAVSLDRLAREIVELYESRARERGVVLAFDCAVPDASVSGAEDGLRSVITNLLSNAIAYTPRGGFVTVRIGEQGDRILLEVKDTGIGVPREERDRIFSEFFRASNAKATSEIGTGLGLAIVKANVERYGGTIEFDSEEGKGTLFRISLHKAESQSR